MFVDDIERQQRRIRNLETQNRSLAEKARKNDVRHLIKTTEKKVTGDLQQMRNQMTHDARQAQVERLEVQKRMEKTFNEVTGVKREIKNTQDMITDIRRQMNHYEAEARRQRNQIRQDVKAVGQEVKKNRDMIDQNRQKIDRNYTEMKKEFEKVLKTLDNMERKREAEKALNASEIIDQVFAKMESISKRFAQLHDPDYYNEAVGNYNKPLTSMKVKNSTPRNESRKALTSSLPISMPRWNVSVKTMKMLTGKLRPNSRLPGHPLTSWDLQKK
jgi:DNA repair exonuclease SbcCD ATPase subunit